MKHFLACALCCIAVMNTPPAAQSSAHLWSHLYGGTSDQYGQAIAVDPNGDVIVAGTFWNAIDLGGGVLTSAGMTDVFLAKFDATGAHVWSHRFGDSGLQNTTGAAVDANGNVALTGYFRGTVDFGGGGLTSAGSSDIFIAGYDANGTHQWSKRFGDAYSDQGKGVAFDLNGNVVLVGAFNGTVDFGGGPLAGAGALDAFVASFDATGAHRWSRRFGDGDSQEAWSVSIDPFGHISIGGGFSGSIDFGGGPLTSAGAVDVFVASLNSAGNHRWSARHGSALDQWCHGVAADVHGNTWLTGFFLGSVNFGGGTLTSAGDRDVFVAKFDSLGTHQASVRFGNAAAQTGWAIATDSAGNVSVAGDFAGSIDCGGGPLSSAGGSDVFVALLDGAAAHRWSNRYGDVSNDVGYGIAVDALNRSVFTGLARGTVDFGGGPLVAAGGADAFVASFAAVPSRVTPGMSHEQALEIFPNPFNPATTIQFIVPSQGRVTLAIYDSRGSRVTTLVDDERNAGAYTRSWRGVDERGGRVSSGVYFARLTHAAGTATCKMVLLK